MYNSYLSLLKEYISFQSISTDKSFSPEMTKTANWLKQQFEANKFDVQLVEWYGNPIVIARYHHDDTLPTVLIYGHYDVQPAEQEDGWEQSPFDLRVTEQRLYARGAVDNKGQCAVHMTTVFELIKNDALAYNVVFMIEGDEETGSPLMPQFVKDYAQELKADFAMISDGEIMGNNPQIETGFRGGFNTTLTIRTARTDLHSGIYGGVAASSSHEMLLFLSKMYDPATYNITIPWFYDDVAHITEQEHQNNQKIPFSEQSVTKIIEAKAFVRDTQYLPIENVAYRPTAQVTGMSAGYTGEGYRNGIPATATAKINFRLVKNQDPHKIVALFKDFVAKNLPDHLTYDLEINDPYSASRVDINNDYVTKTKETLEKTYGEEVIFAACGGGLPIVGLFEEYLSLTNVLVPFGNDDCNMHGVSENFRVDLVKKALEFSKEFLSK